MFIFFIIMGILVYIVLANKQTAHMTKIPFYVYEKNK